MSHLLDHILSKLQSQSIVSPFIIIHGPGADAKWEEVISRCEKSCGYFAYHDILCLKDYTQKLGKPHTIKVEYKKSITSDLLLKEYNYEDKGSREINDWLAHSPSGDQKILLIEHIDRTNSSSANALLKSLEEPLPWRCIIASTTNKDLLLPTILSRALLIHCDAVYNPSELNEEQKKIFSDTILWLSEKNIIVLSKSASLISKSNFINNFLDNLLYYYHTQSQYDKIPLCVYAMRMLASNVSQEHVLFNLFLKL